MDVTVFGSSALDLPFAFPASDLAASMTAQGVSTSAGRVNSLIVSYWDAIDAGDLDPLSPGTNSDAMLRRVDALDYLSAAGFSRAEANAFIAALVSYPDAQWLTPSWSLTKTMVQEATGKGAQGQGGS